MPASITLSDLSWSTPDGNPLFSGLSLDFRSERTGLVGRNGTGKTTLLGLISGAVQPHAGSVRVSGTIGLMRQDIGARPGDTIADLFGAASALALLDRAEAGLADADALAEADWTLPARIEAALLRCDLAAGPQTRLAALSGGQRTRAALAALIFAEPDFILLDEPTNNLDRAGRRAVVELIRGWRKGAILVSHDGELLEEVDAIVELTSLGATRYGVAYGAYRARKAEALEAASRDLAQAERGLAETGRRAQQAVERKARKDAAGHRSRAKGGKPVILMDAAKGRAEASGGNNARVRDARREEAEEAVAAAREQVEILQPLRMELPSTRLPPGRLVLRLDAVTGGHDLARPVIRDFSLSIVGPERLAIGGPNGSGKTTLLALISGGLAPSAGRVDLQVPCAVLDQHVGLLDPYESLRENFARLNPAADENQIRAALARFRFRADDALRRAGDLSGGERLRAGLACTLGGAEPPMLLILDEPTNHLDHDSSEALAAALASYDGALIVVSHDEAFLDRLALDRRVDLGEATPPRPAPGQTMVRHP